jgi:hypothetical protein
MLVDRQRHVQTHWMRMLILPALIAVFAACRGSEEAIQSPEMTAEPSADLRSTGVVTPGAAAYAVADLVADLRATGLPLELTHEIVDHGFAIQGQRVLVDDIPVFVYEFADATAADIAFAGVSVDEYSITVTRPEGEGTVETHGDWMETPHLYKRGRLIVIAGDHARVLDALDKALGAQVWSPTPRDCSIPNAFPPEEAELIWPTLRQVQPSRAVPGDQVEIRGTGGFLYWNNECGEFRNESARDFQLFFDGETVGSITCYAHTCLADLTVPADAAPGIHTISIEGGSSIDIEIGGETPLPQSSGMQALELVGYLGTAQAQAVAIQGHYAYVGIDIELAVVDASDPKRPQRVGHLFLPEPVMDVALVKDTAQDQTYAYAVAGNGAGLYVVETTDPTELVVRGNYYSGSYVSAIAVAGDRAYVSGNVLHILDVTNPAAPVEVSTHSLTQGTSRERVAAIVAGDPQSRTYAYMAYEDTRIYGFRVVDVTDPAALVPLGSLTTSGPTHEAAIVGEYAYLLVGPGIGRLIVVDISDPQNPREVTSARAGSWGSESLAVQDHYLYLAGYDLSEYKPDGGLQVLDIADPAHPVALGRYEAIAPSVLDVSVEGERAYVAAGDGLAVLDISNPTTPTGTGTYHADALTGTDQDLAVVGSTVYIAAGEAGLLVVNASDPENPRVVGNHDTAGHTWAIALVERDLQGHTYAYLADEYNGLRVIDVSSPLAPVEVGAYDVPGQYEFFHGVAIEGDYAYVADGGLMDTRLRVVNISHPAHPFEVASLPLVAGVEGTPPPRVEDVAVADDCVYLVAGTAGLRVIDVSDPLVPVEIGYYGTAGRADNLTVADSYAYLVDGDLRIVDVSNPAAPAEVGFYDVPDLAITPHVAVQGHRAYLTGDGLRILDITNPGALLEVARHPIPLGSVAVASDVVYVIGRGLFVLQASPPVY